MMHQPVQGRDSIVCYFIACIIRNLHITINEQKYQQKQQERTTQAHLLTLRTQKTSHQLQPAHHQYDVYLVVDTGKLYHHKMRLDSIMRKPKVGRMDVLDYIKNKHHLYFVNGKVKDEQLLKFIDKIVAKNSKNKPALMQIKEQSQANKLQQSQFNQDGDFDYLNDDEYEEDYEDYEQPEDKPSAKPVVPTKKETAQLGTKFNKNTFMTYCQQYEQSNEDEGGAQWDLDMDQSADFV